MTPVPGSLVSTLSTRRAPCSVHRRPPAPGVDGVADADPSAVVDSDPGGTRGDVEHGVEDGPVGHGVGSVEHRFGLPVGRGHRP